MHTHIHVPHTETAHTCTHRAHTYMCTCTHSTGRCSQQGDCVGTGTRACVHVMRHRHLEWALLFLYVLQLQRADQSGQAHGSPHRREASIRQRGTVCGQEGAVTCRGEAAPRAHVTCLSSWASPSETNGSLICSGSNWPSWLPEQGSRCMAQSISPDAAMENQTAVTSSRRCEPRKNIQNFMRSDVQD